MKLNEVFDPEDDQPIPAARKRKAAQHFIDKNRGDVKKWKQIYKENNPRDIYRALKPIIDNQIRPITMADVEAVREDKHALKEMLYRICAIEESKFRHPEIEQEIITNPLVGPFYVSLYAINVIRGPWPEAEQAILTKPEGVKHTRERSIWTYAHAACHYAVDALKSRWPAGEPNIMRGIEGSLPTVAYYDWMVHRGKWVELQEYILNNFPDPNKRRELVKRYKEILDDTRRTNKPL